MVRQLAATTLEALKPTIFDHSAQAAETKLPIDPSGSSVRAGFDFDQGNCGVRNRKGVRALYWKPAGCFSRQVLISSAGICAGIGNKRR
jgi:hypothetical protein